MQSSEFLADSYLWNVRQKPDISRFSLIIAACRERNMQLMKKIAKERNGTAYRDAWIIEQDPTLVLMSMSARRRSSDVTPVLSIIDMPAREQVAFPPFDYLRSLQRFTTYRITSLFLIDAEYANRINRFGTDRGPRAPVAFIEQFHKRYGIDRYLYTSETLEPLLRHVFL